jgi:hypothetical protein
MTANAAEPTFFPNATTVYVPRGTAQLLKPYLPAGEAASDNLRFVVETPAYLKFVAVEPGVGSPPARVRQEPGDAREGVAYVRNVLEYDRFPTTGFELSICWMDDHGTTLSYQPAIAQGGTFDWRRLTGTLRSPKGARQARPLIIKWQKRGISGTFWVDNVVFRRADRQANLLAFGTFDEPEWKSAHLKPEGKDGRRCAKFVCPPEEAERQHALWMDPKLKSVAVEPETDYVVELDLKAEKLGAAGQLHIASLLFHADADAPEGRGQVRTYRVSSDGNPLDVRPSELVILPPLKNVRPKQARIAPCHYTTMYAEKVAEAYAENAWQSGVNWTYGSVHNNVVSILQPRGHRVWLNKPGEPFEAHGKAGDFLQAHPELRAIGYDGTPRGGLFCPTWLLSSEGAQLRRLMEDDLVELVNRDGYTAVNWDIEQTVCWPAKGGKGYRGFCLCPRCLGEFRKQQRLGDDVKLDGETIVAKHKDAWVMFRCQQNADLVGHVRTALRRCARPIEFSIYSGYQRQATRDEYGVDWALLAPHLNLAIAGYGGNREAIRATREALGRVPFIGGQLYFLSPAPQRATATWMKNDLAARPNPIAWRNRLLQQFVDGGSNGVLIWYLPTMDGGCFYYTSEAAEIIARYEDLFQKGDRCDAKVRVAGLKPEQWAAFEQGDRRLLLLMNFSAKPVSARVEQPEFVGSWEARLHGDSKPAQLDPKAFDMPLEPWGTRVIVFSKR